MAATAAPLGPGSGCPRAAHSQRLRALLYVLQTGAEGGRAVRRAGEQPWGIAPTPWRDSGGTQGGGGMRGHGTDSAGQS